MPRSPATLPRHELIGLPVSVRRATNPDLLDIEGAVVMETTKTLSIERGGRTWQVPKAGTTFAFDLPGADDRPTAVENCVVTVEGERLLARPARRTERRGDSTWR